MAQSRGSVRGPTQTTASHTGLSKTVIAAQQRLSEKYGIVTFDVTGKISTVPLTRDLDPTNDTGTGGLDRHQFNINVTAIRDSTLPIIPSSVTSAEPVQPQIPFFSPLPVESLFVTSPDQIEKSELTPAQLFVLDDLDRQIADLKSQIKTLQPQAELSADAQRQLTSTLNAVEVVMKKRADYIHKSVVLNRVVVPLHKLITEMTVIANTETLTYDLVVEADSLLQQRAVIVTKILENNIDVPKELMLQLQQLAGKLLLVIQRFKAGGSAGNLESTISKKPVSADAFKDWPFGLGIAFETMEKSVSDTFTSVLHDFEGLLDTAIKDVIKSVGLDKPVDIEAVPAKAVEVAGTSLIAGAGIYALATATDLLHPLKGTGIVPTAISIVDKLGTGLITGTIIGGIAGVTLGQPLRLYYQSLVRPVRPLPQFIDRMWFKGQIDRTEYGKLYAYQGWTDDYTEKWFKAMFAEPNTRILLKMFLDPEVPKTWIDLKLKEGGLSDEDRSVISAYATRQATDKEKQARITISLQRYKLGYLTFESFVAELRHLGAPDQQISDTTRISILDRDTEHRTLLRDALLEEFDKGVISENELQQGLGTIIPDNKTREFIINRAVAKIHKNKKDTTIQEQKKQKRELDKLLLEQATEAFSKDVITLDELRTRVTPLFATHDLSTTYVELQRIKDIEVKKAKIRLDKTTISESNAKKRFTAGYTSLAIFQNELKAINKTDNEIKLITVEAQLEKDIKHREQAVQIIQQAFRDDIITDDELREDLSVYVVDPVVLGNLVQLELLRKKAKLLSSKKGKTHTISATDGIPKTNA